MLDELEQAADELILAYQFLQKNHRRLQEQYSQLIHVYQQLEKKHTLAGDKIKQLMVNIKEE